jgi:tetratricopeptide (TPR) repeat protein
MNDAAEPTESESPAPDPQPEAAPEGAPAAAPADAASDDEKVSPLTWLVLVGLLVVVIYSLIPSTTESGLPSGDDVQALLSEGRAVAKRTGDGGGVEGALPYFWKAVKVAPEDATASGTLGRALVELGRFEEALPFLEKAKAAAPKVYEVNLYLGMCLTGMERHKDARVFLEESIRIRPTDPQPLYFLGVGAMRLDDPERTVVYLKRYVVDVPRNLVALRMYIDALEMLGKKDDALAAFKLLVSRTPGDVPARRALQSRRLRSEPFEAVLKDAAADVEREKGPEALYLHARLLGLSPDHATEARTSLEQLKTSFPQVVRADLDLAIEDGRDGKLDAARVRLNAVVASSPGSVEARALLADLELQAGRIAEARTAYEGLLGGKLNAHAELGIVSTHVDEGDGEGALRFVRDLLEGASEADPRRWALEGELLKTLGRFDESRKILDTLLEKGRKQDRVIWQGYVAFLELERGDMEAATTAFGAVVEAAGTIDLPPDISVWAGVAARGVDMAQARAQWEKAASGPDYDSMALHTRGAKRLLHQVERDPLTAAARIAGYRNLNDALFFEGLSLELSGDAAGAAKAYAEALEATRGDEFPARLIRRGAERVK